MSKDESNSVDHVYEQLLKGVGHELVNDDNVAALIKLADDDKHTILATELREWQAPCG